MSLFKGSAVAIITPFTEEGINFEVFGELIERQISGGTDAIVVCGTTGEPSTMTKEEKLSAIKFCIEKVNGRVPVIAGTGGNNTSVCIEMSIEAEKLGADALLVVTPYYNKCTQKGLIEHYSAIADSVNIPVIAYNVPGRTGVNMLPATVKELRDRKKICAVKEAGGNIAQISKLCALINDDFDIYSGDDDIILPVLALGGAGIISVAANVVPNDVKKLCSEFFSGNIAEARAIQFRLMPLVSALFSEVNPIPVKTAVNLMGYNAGSLRMPLCEMEDANLELLKKAMKDYGIEF